MGRFKFLSVLFVFVAASSFLRVYGGEISDGHGKGEYIALIRHGEELWQRNKRDAAAKEFRKAHKLAPDYPYLYFLIGRTYFFERKYDAALENFKVFANKMEGIRNKDERLTDSYISALHKISRFYSSLKRFDLIGAFCKKIIKLRPDDQVAHYNLAICYYNHYKNRSRAYSELKKVIDINYATGIADKAKLYIDYMRNNPDPLFKTDFSFIFSDD